ncbi:F0F1 ATP synthase subunit gamma [Streptococcus iniae]|uniref:ATP synthase gamma chain n=1 Tax=Streptococcus iniae TaxID=1346 RepID=A0A3L8GI03_STRIN|nr:F0F1 ATP synthase subunit gamma [Streptococcus iniae]AGM99032.1 ATP synthase F0F1 subunit gamma [Streptococcus iniae SF1]AHY15980.1 ATP synthase F0F1 subunit gamma [Streptococcus iniae]AHY17846.1 ATP synthase F0F1 subunit gamma [Streptococcus iniae]AJG26138.1 ATP synthase F0F1 subunit gamma [Streptococcus iniae]APD32016.1 F0F1 ATP synthase subunit gamma [Streptococcus iniae]
MVGSLSEIKAKIVSTEKTSKITSAMRMVSSAKLVKSEQAARDFQIYASKIRKITTDFVKNNNGSESRHPMLANREVKKTGYIVMTSDKGLVGAYNSKILKSVMEMIEEYHADGSYSIISIGSVGSDFFKSRGMNVSFELRGLSDQPSFEDVGKIISQSVELYQNEIFDELYVCYNHHVNSLTSQVRVQQMLPISDLVDEEANEEALVGFEIEPNYDVILNQLLPQFTESLIYAAIIDAKTAEHAAGMTAMQTATDNAENVIDELTIQYNRARQAAITQEITEIVAGANALE